MSTPTQYNKKNNDTLYWIIALGAIFTGFAAPLGVIMIALKLADKKKPAPAKSTQSTRVGARTTSSRTQTAKPKGKQTSPIAALNHKGKQLMVIGGILAGIFGLGAATTAADCLWMLPDVAWYLSEILPTLCFTGCGLGLFWAGSRKRKRARRYRSYLAMIGQQKTASVAALASAAGCSADRVREDLEDMLSDGLFPYGFLDYGNDRLFLSPDGLQPEPKPAPAPTQEEAENAVLTEIRQVNDSIRNEKMSAQIDRIGTITAKILDYQKSNPGKAPQLHSFLSYYLPTTLKILRAYAQLEAQGVSGENITAAMQRIEGMMDKVVEGFEKQLDLLFQGDAMDIATDVEVLERMLAKDGLSGQQGMTLGL